LHCYIGVRPLIYNGQEFGADNDVPEGGPGRVIPRPHDWNGLRDGIGEQSFRSTQKMIDIRKKHAG